MRLIYKRILSSLLTITIFSGTIQSLAIENNAVDINISSENLHDDNIMLPQELPNINVDEKDSFSISAEALLNNNAELKYQTADISEMRISMPESNELVIPDNKFELDKNWVSENEIDAEDMAELEDLKENKRQEAENQTKYIGENSSARKISSSPIDESYRIANINGKDSFALQNQTGRTSFIGDNLGEEYIDPMTGNLIVTETDLVLPGVDGLDLNLSRYYSLAQAELYTKTADISTDSKRYTLPAGCYVVTEQIYNTETEQTGTYHYAYSSRDEADTRVEEIKTRDTCDGLYIYNAWWDISSEGDTIDYDYFYTSEITSSSYQTVRNNLGAGWSWSFPSVQVIKDNYQDYDEFEFPNAIYYHDGKGNVMEVQHDEPNGCYFTNYVGQDIVFDILGYYDENICNESRIDYMAEDSDCTKYYFGIYGEIRSIIDIHGNKIVFSYTDKDFYGAKDQPIISSITDTVGRVLNFKYTSNGDYDYINIEITSPVAEEGKTELLYMKKMIDVSYMDEYFSTEPFLESVTYPNGDMTTYYPADVEGKRSYAQPVEFTFADKSFQSDYVVNTSGYTNTLVYLLGNVVRSHSNTYYRYDLCERNLGHSGISQAYRVSERGDDLLVVNGNEVIDGYSENVAEYRYSRDYTGYPAYNSTDSIPEDKYVCRVREYRENSTFIRDFYKKDNAVLKYTENITYNNPVGDSLHVTYTIEDYLLKMPSMIKASYSNDSGYTYDSYKYIKISTYNDKTFGKPLLETEETDYETAIGQGREKHGISYTYDANTGFLLTKSWYQSDSIKCSEKFIYDSNGRLISHQTADGTKTSYTYEYTNGKVSKKTTTVENDTGNSTVIENYTAETSYAFPSTVVKTVTADNVTKTETTSYAYNMLLGTVKSMTDNDGNTTYYEYDDLARLIKIIYPIYSTYSGYGNKDVNVLPIENIDYETVIRPYDGVISSGENLIAQQITDTVSYYDVSNVEADNPKELDLSTIIRNFYAAKINYYLGTGELIESNVLDTVGGDNGINTTLYYYDTSANTVKEVDPKGDTKIIQYDGAGREVKITDSFGNYHITEYNRSSAEAGFKALSYLIPASNRQAKENITEYTYDRLGRTVNEKAYADFPNAFIEVKYKYDLAGNVVGIIDANNTLNEDGYTQTNAYDKLDRLVSSKNANNEVVRNTYDYAGNIKKQTITDNNGTESILYTRSYDGEGKIISDTDNAGNSNLYTYDDMGRLEISQDKDSKIGGFGYNELGVLDSKSSAKPEASVIARNYSYKNPYGVNDVFGIQGAYNENTDRYDAYINEITHYSYTPTGRVTEKYSTYADSTGINGVYFKPYMYYTYDSNGNVVSALHGTVDDVTETIWGASTFYEYDKNRVVKVQIDGENERNTADSANVKYEYYDDGKLKAVIYPALEDGTVLKSEYVYDGLSRLISLTNYKGSEVLSGYVYTYDNNGNILTVNETVGTVQNNTQYTYDKLNRIASVSGSKGADSYYEYDLRGNRKVNFEQIDFLSEENAEFRYNAEDMMYYAKVGDNSTSIKYSDNGFRYLKQENSDYPEFYVYDNNGRLQAVAASVKLSMTDGSTVSTMFPIVHYIWGTDRVLAKIDKMTNKSYYYLYNGHGDVVQIVDTAGNVVNSYDYDVWGNFITKQETIGNHFTYFGQTYDETTGLYYLRARYYDPTTGRFTQQDTAEDGYNWYVYGNQNPVLYADYYGLFWEKVVGIATNPNVHRLVWYIGAEKYLKSKGYYTSAWMLEHSLLSNPSNEYRGNDSRIAELIKSDNAFLRDLDIAIMNSDGKTLDDTIYTTFENGDLYYSIHRSTIELSGYKMNNGKWKVYASLSDKYDYTEVMTLMNGNGVALGTIANDAATVSQIIGAINPYRIYVDFTLER